MSRNGIASLLHSTIPWAAPLEDAPSVILPDANENAVAQAQDASDDLSRKPSDFLRPPFASLATLIGDIPEGDLWYVAAFSSDGKTAFFSSLALALVAQGRRVYYVPTETPARVLRNHFAAKTLGYDVGDMLSGAWLHWPNYEAVKSAIRQELGRQTTPDAQGRRQLLVGESGLLTATRLEAEAAHAADLGADIFIVDHIDHVEAAGGSPWESNMAANKTLLRIAHTYNLRVFAATQFNLEAVKGRRVMRYLPPRETYVYMGNYKRQIANGMLGLYRPLKFEGLDVGLLKQFNAGSSTVKAEDICEPQTMAVSLMKHRLYGNREGQRIFLNVHRGRVQDMPSTETGAIHGISTIKRGLF